MSTPHSLNTPLESNCIDFSILLHPPSLAVSWNILVLSLSQHHLFQRIHCPLSAVTYATSSSYLLFTASFYSYIYVTVRFFICNALWYVQLPLALCVLFVDPSVRLNIALFLAFLSFTGDHVLPLSAISFR